MYGFVKVLLSDTFERKIRERMMNEMEVFGRSI